MIGLEPVEEYLPGKHAVWCRLETMEKAELMPFSQRLQRQPPELATQQQNAATTTNAKDLPCGGRLELLVLLPLLLRWLPNLRSVH